MRSAPWLAVSAVLTVALAGCASAASRPAGGGGDTRSPADCFARFRSERVDVQPSSLDRHDLHVSFDLSYRGPGRCVVSAYAPSVTIVGPDGMNFGTNYDTSLVGYEPDHVAVRPGDRVRDSFELTFLCPRSGPGHYEADVYLGPPTRTPPDGVRLHLGEMTPPPCAPRPPVDVGISSFGPPRVL